MEAEGVCSVVHHRLLMGLLRDNIMIDILQRNKDVVSRRDAGILYWCQQNELPNTIADKERAATHVYCVLVRSVREVTVAHVRLEERKAEEVWTVPIEAK